MVKPTDLTKGLPNDIARNAQLVISGAPIEIGNRTLKFTKIGKIKDRGIYFIYENSYIVLIHVTKFLDMNNKRTEIKNATYIEGTDLLHNKSPELKIKLSDISDYTILKSGNRSNK